MIRSGNYVSQTFAPTTVSDGDYALYLNMQDAWINNWSPPMTQRIFLPKHQREKSSNDTGDIAPTGGDNYIDIQDYN